MENISVKSLLKSKQEGWSNFSYRSTVTIFFCPYPTKKKIFHWVNDYTDENY